MAFTRDHINAFAIVGGDSDFIALVEKLKQYDKRVFVVGGRQFTSGILQRNCHEFIAYENLLEAGTTGDGSRPARAARVSGRGTTEIKPLSSALPNIQRALKILAEREVAPQLGLLKSTLLQLDATFTERDYGAGSFLDFIRKLEKENLIQARRTDRGYLVEMVEGEVLKEAPAEVVEPAGEIAPEPAAPAEAAPAPVPGPAPESGLTAEETFLLLKRALATLMEKAPSRPIYLRQVRQAMRSADARFDERQAGFRGLLDLLHQAQREGWLRLHRDRKGIWRIFATTAETARLPVVPEAVPEAPAETLPEAFTETFPEPFPEAFPEPEAVPEAESAPPETDVQWETVESPDETIVLEPAEAAPPASEPPGEPLETVADKKTRRAHGAKRGAKKGPRKTVSRRKPKEPKEVPI